MSDYECEDFRIDEALLCMGKACSISIAWVGHVEPWALTKVMDWMRHAGVFWLMYDAQMYLFLRYPMKRVDLQQYSSPFITLVSESRAGVQSSGIGH
jgi:hypothetical protein